MNTNKKTTEMKDTKVLLSTLWIVVMINMLKADILSLYIPGILDELAEFAGETPITQLMLGGAIMMEISIAMIFLSRILKYRVNRWANIIVGVTIRIHVARSRHIIRVELSRLVQLYSYLEIKANGSVGKPSTVRALREILPQGGKMWRVVRGLQLS